MSIIAEFRLRSPKLVLHDTFEALPELSFEVVREVGTDPERPYLFVWVSGVDAAAFETTTADDPTVTDVRRYTELDGRTLFRLRLTSSTEAVFYPVWVEAGADLLEASHRDGYWSLRMRFPDRDALSGIETWCESAGVEFHLDRIYAGESRNQSDSADEGLTDPQREVLRVALEMGYFEVPRAVSMAEVADEIGISGQAVSERLRRGHRALIDRYVATQS